MFVESLRNSKNHFSVFPRESKADHEKWLLTSPNQIFMGECRETCLISFHDMRKVDDIVKKKKKKNTGIAKKKKLPFGGGFRTSFFFSLLSQKRITCSSCIWNIYDLYQTTSIMKRRKTSRIDHNQSRHTQCRCQCYIYVCPIYSITMFSTLQLYTIYNCSVGGWQSSFRENTTQHQKARWQLTWSRCNWWLRMGEKRFWNTDDDFPYTLVTSHFHQVLS